MWNEAHLYLLCTLYFFKEKRKQIGGNSPYQYVFWKILFIGKAIGINVALSLF
jgi:hypothetical protein